MEKENDVLISIIVGIYNGEKYLKECVDSIISQTYKNIEILLVNDGSTDSSKKILESYLSDKRVMIIDQSNQGVSASRNKALSMARGDYICFVDQDDVLDDNYVEYFLNLIISTDSQIAMTPQPDKFFKNKKKITGTDKISIISGKDAVIQMLYHKFVIAPWNKMISKKLIDEYNIRFNSQFFCGEGFAFSIECFQRATRVAVGNQKVYHYRVGDPNTGASKFKDSTIISSINAQKYIREKLIYSDDETIKAWEFSNWHTHCDCFNIFVGCNAKKKNIDMYNEIYSICKKNGLCAIYAPVSFEQKLRGLLFKINPVLAAKIINRFRLRKFKKEQY